MAMEMYYRKDFRVMIFLKYIAIGTSDVIFWWTVWNIADVVNPIQVTSNGHISFIHGYIFIIAANICYLTTRKCFKKTLGRTEESEQQLYASSIVTITASAPRKPSRRAMLVRCLFPICVHLLTVGIILIWRGYFAVFYYIVEDVLVNSGLSIVASRIILQLIVGVTLIFNQKNNTVNLCPTHKIYKFDELEHLEGLFKMNVLNMPSTSDNNNRDDVESGNELEVIPNLNSSAEELPASKKTTVETCDSDIVTNPFHHEFSSALCLARLLKKFHKSKGCSFFPRKWYREKGPQLKHLCGPADHVRINIDILTMISRSCGINFIENVGLLSEDHSTVEDNAKDVKPAATVDKSDSCVGMYVEIFQSKNDKINEKERTKKGTTVTANHHAEENCSNVLTLVGDEVSKCTCGKKMVKKLSRTMTPSELDEIESQIAREYNELNKPKSRALAESTVEETRPCPKNCLHCRLAHVVAYIYVIHYEQIFLNTFGAIFWSSTWGLYDQIIHQIYTNTPKDIPWLLLVAITCHCINHLVLFRVKETSVTLRWRTVCEFLCGINTVCFWASMWHVLDIVSLLAGSKTLLLLIIPHVTVFAGLSIFKLSINVAL